MKRWTSLAALLTVLGCDEGTDPAPEPSAAERSQACERLCERQESCDVLTTPTRAECVSACEANLTEDCASSRWEPTLEAREACLADSCEALPDCLAAAQCVAPSQEPDADDDHAALSCEDGTFEAHCPFTEIEVLGEVAETYCLENRTVTESEIDAWLLGCPDETGVKGSGCPEGPIGACELVNEYGCTAFEHLSVAAPRTVDDLIEGCLAIDGVWIPRSAG